MKSKAVPPKSGSSWREQREGGAYVGEGTHSTRLTLSAAAPADFPAHGQPGPVLEMSHTENTTIFLASLIQNLICQRTAQPWKEHDFGDQLNWGSDRSSPIYQQLRASVKGN